MFLETAYLGDAVNPGGTPLWQQQGFTDKASWKAAGRPGAPVDTTTPAVDAGGGSSAAPGTPAATAPAGGGGFLSGIPSNYLLIGGVIALLLVLKK